LEARSMVLLRLPHHEGREIKEPEANSASSLLFETLPGHSKSLRVL
jgi:hypothetical protein